MSWDRKHLLNIEAFSRGDFEYIFDLSTTLLPYSGIDKSRKRRKIDVANGDILTLWFEPQNERSTRTYGSFQGAMMRLGGGWKDFDEDRSSMGKGEDVEDTARILSQHSDIIVDRHRDEAHVHRLATYATVPVINGGNGSHEHPTQTVLDLYTIQRKRRGGIDGSTIVIVGDPKNGRTAHSLCIGIRVFDDVHVACISPEGAELPNEFKPGNYQQYTIDMKKLNEALGDIKPDVVYATRPQVERGTNIQPYSINQATLKVLPQHTLIMHPLPRDSKHDCPEIAKDVDTDPRAIYFKQAAYGVPTRMALIATILDYAGLIHRDYRARNDLGDI